MIAQIRVGLSCARGYCRESSFRNTWTLRSTVPHNASVKNTALFLVLLLSSLSLTASDQRPPITGVAYVRIAAKDPAASHKFYSERLGFPLADCGKGCKGYRISATQSIEVVKADGTTDGLILVAFRTGDAKALRNYLAANNVKVPEKVEQKKDGSQEFELNDPEGHRIAFLQQTTPPPALNSKGISHRMIHAGFVVKDRAAMDRFYKDVLGFQLYWQGGMKDDVSDWVDMQVPDGTDWLEYMLNVGPDADHRLLGILNHFALGTTSIKDAHAQLEKTGWKSTEQEKSQIGRDGKWQLNLYDPDETRAELMEFTPVEKPCCSDYLRPHPKP